jgi:hypothetical protein
VIDEVFQASELVEPYRVAPSIDLEENSNFHVFDDSLVDFDAEELNAVLSSTSGLENVDEEDDNHIEECDEADDNKIQLRTKMKILTKHVVKPYFYNVIFWNMKYLFFFNC